MENLLPTLILENYKNNKFDGELNGFTMFADISGFTSLTERLMENGHEGAEILSNTIKNIFNSTVGYVYKRGGFITSFAGDAFTAIFPVSNKASRNTQSHNCLLCAEEILLKFQKNPIQETRLGEFEFKVKVGLSFGKVEWTIVGEKNKAFFFKGDAIDGCIKSEQNAGKNEVIIDRKIQQLVLKDDIETELTNDEFYKIKNFKNLIPQTTKGKYYSTQTTVTHKIFSKKFLPQEIFDVKEPGEFRNIASVLISFKEINSKKGINKLCTILIDNLWKNSGYLSNIDFGDKGSTVICFFGAPVSLENNIERAIDFLLSSRKMIAEDKSLNRFRIRAGVTYGKVYAGLIGGKERCQYSMLGDVVNLAARFMTKTNWDEIWVSEVIYQKFRNTHKFESTGKHRLKGFSKEIAAYKLIDKPDSEFYTFYNSDMVGREAEIKKMKDFVKEIFESRSAGLLYVHGEAGIGKSRLVNQLRKELESNERINWFYCPNDDIKRKPFNPFKYFLRDFFNQSLENSNEINKSNFNKKIDLLISKLESNKDGIDEVKNELERTRSILGAMVDLYWEGSLYEQLEPQLRFENTIFAFYNLVTAECTIKPVIMEIEDAHWIDNESIEVLKILLQNIAGLPFMVIFSSRFYDDSSKFIIKLDEEIPQLEVELKYLTKKDTEHLTEQTLNNRVDKDAIDFLFEKTNGNPYFIEQMILDFKERGLWKKENKNYTISPIKGEAIPSSINSVLVSRFDRLAAKIKEVVQAASVLGREFEVQILTQILKNVKNLDSKIETAEKENIWYLIKELRYIFKHALLRDAVYYMQLKSKLRELHLLASESINYIYRNNMPLDIEEQYSYHLGIGSSIINEKGEIIVGEDQLVKQRFRKNLEKYLQLQKNLADKYKKEYSNNEAIQKCNLVIEISNILNSKETVIDYLLKKGAIYEFIGKLNESEKSFEEALNIAEKNYDIQRKGNCFLSLGNVFCGKGYYEKAKIYLDKALRIFQILKDNDGISKVYFTLSDYWKQSNFGKAMEYNRKSLKICEASGNNIGISKALGNISVLYRVSNDLENALQYSERSLKISKELKNKALLAKDFRLIGDINLQRGNKEQAMKNFNEALKLSEEVGNRKNIATVLANIGIAYIHKFEYEKAINSLEKSNKIFKEIGDRRSLSLSLLNLGSAYHRMGNFAKGFEYNMECQNIAKEINDKYILASVYRNTGWCFYLQKNYQQAITYFKKEFNSIESFGIKHRLGEALIKKAIAYYKLKNFNKANELNVKGLSMASEAGDKEVIFLGRILSLKIEFSIDDKQKMKAYEKLKEMLINTNEEMKKAELHYEMYDLLLNDNKKVIPKKKKELHRKEALRLYEKIFTKCPEYEYKLKIDELKQDNS